MSTINTSRLIERLRSVKRSGTSKVFLKIPDDGKSKLTVRMVPYQHVEKNEPPIFVVGWHYDIAGHKSIVCPKETFGDHRKCPICDLANEILRMGGKENYFLSKKIGAQLRFYSPVIVRGKEEEGIKLWGYGIKIFDSIIEKYNDPDWGDISHPVTGRDIKLWNIPKGAPGNDTSYSKPCHDVVPVQSKLLKTKEEIVSLIGSVPNYLEIDSEYFKLMSVEEMKNLVAKMADADDSNNSDFDDFNDSFDTSDNSSNEVEDKLDDLLSELDD